MNWTEGNLARHSRRKGWNEDAAKQKQYFAKAQTRLREKQLKPNPNDLSFISSYISQASSSDSRVQYNPLDAGYGLGQTCFPSIKRPFESSSSSSERLGYESCQPSQGSYMRHPSQPEYREPPNDVEVKRRKLLQQADWTGLVFQKPLFPRSPPPSHHSSSRCRQVHGKQQHVRVHGNGSRPYVSRQYGKEPRDIRIQVDNQKLRWSNESNSVRSYSTHESEHEDTQHDHRNGSTHHTSASGSCLSVTNSSETSGSKLSWATTASISNAHSAEPQANPRTQIDSISSSPKGLEIEPGPMLARGSSPPLLHPQPTRRANLLILRENSSPFDETSSVLARLGTVTPEHQRLTLEDVQWRKWLEDRNVATLDDRASAEVSNSSSPPTISPGMSHYKDSSRQSPSASQTSQALSEEMEPLNEQAKAGLPSAETIYDQPILFPNRAAMTSKPYLIGSEPQPYEIVSQPSSLRVSSYTGLLLKDESNQQQISQQRAAQERLDREAQEEMWKKFVFDEPSPDARRALREKRKDALRQAIQETAQDIGLEEQDPYLLNSSPEQPSTVNTTAAVALSSTSNPEPSPAPVGESPPPDSPASALPILSTPETTPGIASDKAQAGSSSGPSHRASSPEFRIRQPRLFVGRLSSLRSILSEGPPKQQLIQKGKRGRGRPKRTRDRSRPDIRALPNAETDSIEGSD